MRAKRLLPSFTISCFRLNTAIKGCAISVLDRGKIPRSASSVYYYVRIRGCTFQRNGYGRVLPGATANHDCSARNLHVIWLTTPCFLWYLAPPADSVINHSWGAIALIDTLADEYQLAVLIGNCTFEYVYPAEEIGDADLLILLP